MGRLEMNFFKISSFNDAPWKILFLSLFLSLIGLIALISISHQNTPIIQNPFYKQLFFLFIALFSFSFSFLTPKYVIHKYAYIIYWVGVIIVVMPFFGAPHAGTHRWLDIGLPFNFQPSEFSKIF